MYKKNKNESEHFTYIFILKGSSKPRFFLGLQLIGSAGFRCSVINVEKDQSTSGTEQLRYWRFKVFLKKGPDMVLCYVLLNTECWLRMC